MGLTCNTCGATDCGMLIGRPGECDACNAPKRAAWAAKMARRQEPNQFRIERLVGLLLTQHWMHECEIIPHYMPPHPRPDTRPRCIVRWQEPNGEYTYLRHSLGPLQGHGWDIYGDDYHCPELALLALSHAIPPARVDFCIPTHGEMPRTLHPKPEGEPKTDAKGGAG